MLKSKSLHSLTLIVTTLIALSVAAHDYVPGKDQTAPVLLKNGTLYTVSGGILEKTDLLFEDGRISKIGKDIPVPEGCNVIDVTGKRVYPGLIESNSQIGLIEIGAVDATSDLTERGTNNADVRSRVAYNPDSEIIPTVRSNGITTALIVPSGRLVSGRSSLMNLDGWTQEDALEKAEVGLHINWPRASIITAWWMEQTAEEQKKENAENMAEIYRIFETARAYNRAKQADPSLEVDLRWEAMLPLFDGSMKLFASAGDYRQVEQVIAFSKKFGLKTVIVGGSYSWAITKLLMENEIPVILSYDRGAPSREDESYDQVYKTPQILAQKGVKFCLSAGSFTTVRNLPFLAGRAINFGLDPEQALKSVTLWPAEILGVDADLGSLEVGKKATLIVSEGDIFDFDGSNVILEFIEGRATDLDDKQKELYRKYREKEL